MSWDRHYSSLECKMEGQSRQRRACVKHEMENDSACNFFKSKLPIPSELRKYIFREVIRNETAHIDQNLCTLTEDLVFTPGPECEGLEKTESLSRV